MVWRPKMANDQQSSQPYIYVAVTYNDDLSAEVGVVKSVALKLGYSIVLSDSPNVGRVTTAALEQAIRGAVMVVTFVTTIDPDLTMQLGFARGIKKPTIYMASDGYYMVSAFSTFRVVAYNRSRLNEMAQVLERTIRQLLADPASFVESDIGTQASGKPHVFISYSHQDKEYLDRLLVHLKPLEQERRVDVWVDTRIRAGDLWKKEIENALDRSSVAILLVSADFLASDFIRNNELPPILRGAEKKGTRILPVVLKPCRFSRDTSLKEFQSINSPEKPLILLSEGEREAYFDMVAREVEVERGDGRKLNG
jgi:TIR domain